MAWCGAVVWRSVIELRVGVMNTLTSIRWGVGVALWRCSVKWELFGDDNMAITYGVDIDKVLKS